MRTSQLSNSLQVIYVVFTNVYYDEYEYYIANYLAFEYKVEYLFEWTIIVLVSAANFFPLINFLAFVKLSCSDSSE